MAGARETKESTICQRLDPVRRQLFEEVAGGLDALGASVRAVAAVSARAQITVGKDEQLYDQVQVRTPVYIG
jgi:hypothetical protein